MYILYNLYIYIWHIFWSPYNIRGDFGTNQKWVRLPCGTNQKLKSLYLRLRTTHALEFWQCRLPYQKQRA